MGKSAGDQELLLVLFRQQLSVPLAVCGRSASEIHCNVKYSALDHADKLCLRILFLEVQSPQDAFGAHALVVLDEHDVKAGFFHILLVVRLHEIAAAVAVNGRRDKTQALNSFKILLYCYLSHVRA